ncbi:MAG: M43 family zinc metalloprotease [Bacteroidota bacterium]
MRKIKISGIITIGLIISTVTNITAQRNCTTFEQNRQMKLQDHQFELRMKKIEEQVRQFIDAHKQKHSRLSVITIPTVVHIVYNTPAQNLPDSQIVSQIDVLNEDFRRWNADTSNTRPVFTPFAADTRIQFCLAKRDPDNNSATGITRTATAEVDFGTDDAVKFDTLGGKTGWDPSRYLNIWVCKLSSANGYAYYPGISPEYDGVVIHYLVFGRIGDVIPPYHLGRTTTHEVGHWLGLYHPFEGYFTGTGCDGSDPATCLYAGDYICDTPGDITPSYGCDFSENSCVDSPVDYPDQIENFMDYADDDCVNMFTNGQSERVNAVLNTIRQSLLTSIGCVHPDSTYLDAAVLDVIYPFDDICEETFYPEVEIGNASSDTLTSFIINYQIDSSPVDQYNWSGSLPPGETAPVMLPNVTAAVGAHSLLVYVGDPNGGADQNSTNDTISKQFIIIEEGDGWSLPFTQGFENGVFPPGGWYVDNPDNDNYTWEGSIEANGFGNSATSATINNWYYGCNGTVDGLLSPKFDLGSAISAELDFSVAYMEPQSIYYSDTLKVYYSLDCGVTWAMIWEKGGSDLATTPYQGFARFVPTNSQWRTDSVNINSLTGNPLVQFKFDNVSGWGNDLWLDDINILADFEVGIGDNASNDILIIHPNPSNGLFKLTVINPGYPEFRVNVFNILGELVYSQKNIKCDQSYTINLSTIPAGIYFIKTIAGTSVSNQKIIIATKASFFSCQ